eukprot:gene14068-biopygen9582
MVAAKLAAEWRHGGEAGGKASGKAAAWRRSYGMAAELATKLAAKQAAKLVAQRQLDSRGSFSSIQFSCCVQSVARRRRAPRGSAARPRARRATRARSASLRDARTRSPNEAGPLRVGGSGGARWVAGIWRQTGPQGNLFRRRNAS